MRENENINIDVEKKEESGFNIGKILGYLRSYWKLFVLSLLVCMSLAYVYLRRATPIYNVTAKVLLQDSEKGGAISSPADMLADFGMQSQTSNIENEIELMSSMAVVRGAVIDSHLNVKYTSQGKSLSKETTPLLVSMDNETVANLSNAVNLRFVFGAEGALSVSYDCDGVGEDGIPVLSFPCVVPTVAGNVMVERNNAVLPSASVLSVTVQPVDDVVDKYKNGLSISPLKL